MTKRRHLPHLGSFRETPIVFLTVCTNKRRKLMATRETHVILRELWERSAQCDGWWVGHYILMPDHVHFFARCTFDARPMTAWVKMWKSVSSRQISLAC